MTHAQGVEDAGREVERKALARCYECAEDGEDTDIGLPMLCRLVAIGWLENTRPGYWEITFEGNALLAEMGVLP